jgi:hypothetical protein
MGLIEWFAERRKQYYNWCMKNWKRDEKVNINKTEDMKYSEVGLTYWLCIATVCVTLYAVYKLMICGC